MNKPLALAPRAITVPQGSFNACYLPCLSARQRHQIYFGGAGSGKSVFLASRCALDALTGRNTLIVRQVARSLRHSTFNEVSKAITRFGLKPHFEVNKAEMSVDCLSSDAQILFAGLDDVEKIKSLTPRRGVLTDIWAEEATECRYSDIKQLEKRLRGNSPHKKRLTMSFNPVSRSHWIYKAYFTGWGEGQRQALSDDLLILRTTHEDNRFLTPDDRRALEGEQDAYFHRVYTRGEWGEQAGAIIRNWHAEDLSALKRTADTLRFGLDFGYVADPCAVIKLHLDSTRRRIYIMDELYLRGLSNEALAARLKGFCGDEPINCDSAEPKSIAELRRFGVRALAAKKGPDSVRHGLQWLQRHEIICDHSCRHLMEELENYRWRQDRGGGHLPQPEGTDHLIDALRYALEADSGEKFAL